MSPHERSESDTNAEQSDAEWAAGVMGWTLIREHRNTDEPFFVDKTDVFVRWENDWNPDTDANDFRDLLNCEAVREAALRKNPKSSPGVTTEFADAWLRLFWTLALTDQPAALRRLREAMSPSGGR